MARRVPPQSLTRRNPGKLATAASESCWWTETGWLCCTTDTPWPACFPGGVSTPGSGGANAGNRRVSMTRITNPSMIPVAAGPAAVPAGASQYVVAPHGATPGATAWLYTVGVSMPTMVRITTIYNNISGLFVDVVPEFAPSVAEVFGPSTTGGFGEVLAPFSQGGSVRTTAGAPARTANPYQDVQGSLARAGRATRSGQVDWQEIEWLPATFFDDPPSATTRRWVQLVSLIPTPPWPEGPFEPIPYPPALYGGGGLYHAILFKNWGASSEDVIVQTRTIQLPGGGSRVEAALAHAFPNKPPGWPRQPGIRRTSVSGYATNPIPTETMSLSMRPVRSRRVPRQSLTLRNPGPMSGADNYSAEASLAASSLTPGKYNYRAWPGNPDCMVDLASLTLHCPGTPLHGVAVTDVEGDGGEEGQMIAVSFVDPSTGAEVVTDLAVAPEQGVPWWEHDGHCCESCALGEGCSDCEDAA